MNANAFLWSQSSINFPLLLAQFMLTSRGATGYYETSKEKNILSRISLLNLRLFFVLSACMMYPPPISMLQSKYQNIIMLFSKY